VKIKEDGLFLLFLLKQYAPIISHRLAEAQSAVFSCAINPFNGQSIMSSSHHHLFSILFANIYFENTYVVYSLRPKIQDVFDF